VPGASIEVVGDMVIAHEAALGGGPGLLVIAGTGSIAYGHNAAGHTARAGGWGFAVSDEGSGHWIGVRAVSAVLQAHDLGEATLLEPAIMEHWDIASHDELVRVANAHAAPDFAGLFPLVVRAFETGDARARQILVSAGMELGAIAEAVVLRLWRTNDAFAVVMSGGVFSRATAVRQAFEVVLRDMCPNIAVNMSQADPALGALSRARRWPNSNSVEPRV
jgi:N-acetylglucosamine kinase-like BadF-type ATPase